MTARKFPENFLWGSGTAAHQVEGGNTNNDWWDWERAGHIKNNDTSSVACDWWKGERYREDFDLAKTLGHNTHRLSIEWSRIEPREGEFDPNAIAFYRRMLEALNTRGIKPLVTLHHFTTPRWLAGQGGWENPSVVQHFERFAKYAVQELREVCNFWITLNEAMVLALLGYMVGIFPPGEKDLLRALGVMRVTIKAHAAAYHAIKKIQPDSLVGMAHAMRGRKPLRANSSLDRLAVRLRDLIQNYFHLEALKHGRLPLTFGSAKNAPEVRGAQDFIGVNYYFAERIRFDPTFWAEKFTREEYSAWASSLREKYEWRHIGEIEPPVFAESLRRLAGYGLPIYVTENGMFDLAKDIQAQYLVSHLAVIQQAIQAGIPVRGYYWWSLTDNLEWGEGYWPRFGLYHLDVETQKRTPRPVSEIYARIIRENGIADDLMEKYGHAFGN